MREYFLRELMILQNNNNNSTNKEETEDSDKNKSYDKIERKQKVNVTFFSDSGSTGRTLSGSFVACDTNLTHILLNDLITPIGLQSSALLRLNDVIAITYC